MKWKGMMYILLKAVWGVEEAAQLMLVKKILSWVLIILSHHFKESVLLHPWHSLIKKNTTPLLHSPEKKQKIAMKLHIWHILNLIIDSVMAYVSLIRDWLHRPIKKTNIFISVIVYQSFEINWLLRLMWTTESLILIFF